MRQQPNPERVEQRKFSAAFFISPLFIPVHSLSFSTAAVVVDWCTPCGCCPPRQLTVVAHWSRGSRSDGQKEGKKEGPLRVAAEDGVVSRWRQAPMRGAAMYFGRP